MHLKSKKKKKKKKRSESFVQTWADKAFYLIFYKYAITSNLSKM